MYAATAATTTATHRSVTALKEEASCSGNKIDASVQLKYAQLI